MNKFYYGCLRFVLIIIYLISIGFNSETKAAETFTKPLLYETAYPYMKYFLDRAVDSTTGFGGLTRSYQLYLGNNTQADQDIINYGTIAYDQDILGRISLEGGTTAILDTYVSYFKNNLTDTNNPLIKINNPMSPDYTDAGGSAINYGPFRAVRILGRGISNWWNAWDWVNDTGAAACLIVSSLSAYQKTQNIDYKNLAVLLGDYILKLQDTDGGIRYGPRGMYHPTGTDFYWKLKSTEQNERCLYAFEALYTVTNDVKYSRAAVNIGDWLKIMYDKQVHLYHSAATFDGINWNPTGFGYVATDVAAFAPMDMMFTDIYFGATQQERDIEVDAMFTAIEQRTCFLDSNNMPKLFRFSVSQTGDYGTVEWSSQMALAYLRAAQNYAQRQTSNQAKTQEYLNKYNALVDNIDAYFVTPGDDPKAKVAPYASYLDGSVAGNVPTGTGYYTLNCQAALACAYYGFAKAGFDPTKLDGGPGIPNTYTTLNMADVPWYQISAPYNSSGAATAQMILNYIRKGTIVPYVELTQSQIYEYAKNPLPFGGEVNALEMDKVLGHFDPYDTLVSNWSDSYDSLIDGNPYQGYNYSVETFDPNQDTSALNKYMRDICHWMAYTVTKEEWWNNNAELVLHPNTPAAIPVFGSYNRWVAVKGYAASTNPAPTPRTDPFNTPDFTVYGFWMKDPSIGGIGKDTYKTASECKSTYFKPLSSSDVYNGLYLQIAEPPFKKSRASVKIPKPKKALRNLEFIKVRRIAGVNNNEQQAEGKSLNGWRDLADKYLLSDPDAAKAFDGTIAGKAVFVRRLDKPYSDYYLVPFGSFDRRGNFLAGGVIILGANGGYFKEASWTKRPERFLKLDKNEALLSIKKHLLSRIRRLSKNRSQKDGSFLKQYREFAEFLRYMRYAKAELVWQPEGYSKNPYKPYWRIQINWQTWYVTQEGGVF